MSGTATLILVGILAFCAGFLCATWRAASDMVPRLRRPRP